MSTHKNINRICVVAIVISILITFLFMNSEAFGVIPTVRATEYEGRLFDTSRVHNIDIVIDDWDTFLTTCTSEVYSDCAMVIDGKSYKNVAIRGKGNTSLSNVASMDSNRYSFKIEFDHYDKNQNYYGLDKLCLNNIIQDNTYMKDYLAYQLMAGFGVDTPLCSYVYITVNGEDWGLYLAVESVEDAFLERNYGADSGELYKPDSMSFGGGAGNGKNFNFDDIKDKFNFNGDSGTDTQKNSQQDDGSSDTVSSDQAQGMLDFSGAADGNGIPDFSQMGDGNGMPDFSQMGDGNGMPDFSQMGDGTEMPDFSAMGGDGKKGGGMPGGMGMGSDDVKLKYTDDSYDSYSNIFDNAKTDITDADKDRLISTLKSLSENKDIESVVNVEEVIRYFVVHNFLLNGDSYTGSMIHNYYLYEKDGQLSMIPWDYNLAFGTFQAQNANSQINSPIDTPVSGGMSDRPMVNWIFENEEYTELYHKYFSEFIDNTSITELIDKTSTMVDSYVEKDPTKFCEYEEFKTGVDAIRSFCELRTESVTGQLNGTIPSTSEGQSADNSTFVDASALTLSDMGSMGGGFGGGKGGMHQMPQGNMPTDGQSDKISGDNMPQGNMPTDDQSDKTSGDNITKGNMSTSGQLKKTSNINIVQSNNLTEVELDKTRSINMTQNDMTSGVIVNKTSNEKMPQGGMPANGQFDPNNVPGDFDPGNFDPSNAPGDFDPGNFDPSNAPGDFDPGNFDPGNVPGDFDPGNFDPDNAPQMPQGDKQPGGQSDSQSNNNTLQTDKLSQDNTSADSQSDTAGEPTVTDQMPQGNAPQTDGTSGDTQNKENANRPDFGNMKMPGDTTPEAGNSTTSWILLGVSVILLSAGLFFAFKFKR